MTGQTADFEAALQLPYTPPAGLAALEYLRLQVLVDPGDALAETTETNDLADTPITLAALGAANDPTFPPADPLQ